MSVPEPLGCGCTAHPQHTQTWMVLGAMEQGQSLHSPHTAPQGCRNFP